MGEVARQGLRPWKVNIHRSDVFIRRRTKIVNRKDAYNQDYQISGELETIEEKEHGRQRSLSEIRSMQTAIIGTNYILLL